MHVDAKRYLCATDSEYSSLLSPASVQSLQLQGGAFTEAEALAFEQRPFARERCGCGAGRSGQSARMRVPGLEHYRAMIEAALLRAS